MNQGYKAEDITSTIIYILIAFAFISLFTSFFPLFLALALIASLVSGVSILYRYIRNGSFERGKINSKYDEHGSRKIKASVIEMKELDEGAKKEPETPKAPSGKDGGQ